MLHPVAQRLTAIALLSLTLTGCQTPMSMRSSSDDASDGSYSNVGAEWPLKFRAHYFDAYTFSTYGCKVLYANRWRVLDEDDKLQTSSESLGAKYPDSILTAGMGPIGNFPEPAKVTWRSSDGTPLEAEVDIGEIFKDELIRHRLEQHEISGEGMGPGAIPGIILEVNDRTINVYMRAHISTRELQEPGNRYSDFRNDLIQVYSRTY